MFKIPSRYFKNCRVLSFSLWKGHVSRYFGGFRHLILTWGRWRIGRDFEVTQKRSMPLRRLRFSMVWLLCPVNSAVADAKNVFFDPTCDIISEIWALTWPLTSSVKPELYLACDITDLQIKFCSIFGKLTLLVQWLLCPAKLAITDSKKSEVGSDLRHQRFSKRILQYIREAHTRDNQMSFSDRESVH